MLHSIKIELNEIAHRIVLSVEIETILSMFSIKVMLKAHLSLYNNMDHIFDLVPFCQHLWILVENFLL